MQLFAMVSSMRLTIAALLFPMVFHRSEVTAQSPTSATANGCYWDCEASWTAFLSNVSTPRKFLARYQNSTQNATDYYCSSRAKISGCFSACAETYPMFQYGDSKGILSTLANEYFKCFTDDAKCRGKESQFLCDAYYFVSCDDATKRRDDCIASVQAQRGCDITNPTHQSQRSVLTMPLDDALYCLNDFDAGTMDSFTGVQVMACAQYIPSVCLSTLTDTNTGYYLPYYLGNVTCRDIENARDCVKASLMHSVTLDGAVYSMPCKDHPHGDTLVAKIDVILSKLLLCSPTTTASHSTITAIASATTANNYSTNIAALTTANANISTITATTAAAKCYNSCEVSWSALRNTTGTNSQLLARYSNSSERAVDSYCKSVLNISACFSACKDSYSQFLYKDDKYILGTVTRISANCFTDEAQCRVQDSELWCNTYNAITCDDIANSYGKCYVAVQAHRGCNLTVSTHKSQRMVLTKLLDNVLYCFNDVDSFALAPEVAESAQACQQYIPTVCLSSLTDPVTGSYNPYYDGNVTCSDIEYIKECIRATLTQKIVFQGIEYKEMCQSIPNSAVLFLKLLDTVNSLLSCPQTTHGSHFTSTSSTTTRAMAAVSINSTTQATTASQALYASTNPVEVSSVDTKTVPVGMTKESSWKFYELFFFSINSSGLTTCSSFANVWLSTFIALILTVFGF